MEIFDIFLLEAVLNGLLLGGLLALLSLGLNLVFGVIDVVWICYAELIMCGMYTVYYLHVQYHWPLILAMLAAIAVVICSSWCSSSFIRSCIFPRACCSVSSCAIFFSFASLSIWLIVSSALRAIALSGRDWPLRALAAFIRSSLEQIRA